MAELSYSLARFLEVVRDYPAERVQARLLSASDRDLAAVLAALKPPDRETVLVRVGQAKRTRVEEGLERMRFVRLAPGQSDRIAAHLTAHIEGDVPLGPASSHFRPHRAEGGREGLSPDPAGSRGAPDAAPPPPASRRALRRGDLPDNFTRSLYSLSPYRGCAHGCRYCDGRAEKYYVEGDFERDIAVRDWLPDRLAAELPNLREPGMVAVGSGTTDPYQPVEAEARIVGRCAELLAKTGTPVTVMTKSDLVLRDLDAWRRVNQRSLFVLLVSITTLREDVRAAFEPGASPIEARLRAMRAFKAAGCVVGALAMPFLPGITDDEPGIRALYAELAALGVDFVMPGGLTLRPGRQKDLYLETLEEYRPELLGSVRDLYREDRPSGRPVREAEETLRRTLAAVRRDFGMPFLLPHRVYSRALPRYDAFRVLLRDMAELYADRGVDTRPLRGSADRYDGWLIGLRRVFRRRRSLPAAWLAERFEEALDTGELDRILDNRRLSGFARSVLRDGVTLDYTTLRLAPDT